MRNSTRPRRRSEVLLHKSPGSIPTHLSCRASKSNSCEPALLSSSLRLKIYKPVYNKLFSTTAVDCTAAQHTTSNDPQMLKHYHLCGSSGAVSYVIDGRYMMRCKGGCSAAQWSSGRRHQKPFRGQTHSQAATPALLSATAKQRNVQACAGESAVSRTAVILRLCADICTSCQASLLTTRRSRQWSGAIPFQ